MEKGINQMELHCQNDEKELSQPKLVQCVQKLFSCEEELRILVGERVRREESIVSADWNGRACRDPTDGAAPQRQRQRLTAQRMKALYCFDFAFVFELNNENFS